MTHNNSPKIRYVGNSPLLIDKFIAYFKHQMDIVHYHEAPNKDEPFDYFLIIDPIEQEIKRIRMQELWKRTLTSTPSVKMLVIDWWPCSCNGFVSPMDIPPHLPKLLSKAVAISDIKHCTQCHQQMKEAIHPLFEPHGDVSPLIKVIQFIEGIIEHLKNNNTSLVNERRVAINKEFQRYQKTLSGNQTIIEQTPFKYELFTIDSDITKWTQLLGTSDRKIFREMEEGIKNHISKLSDIRKEIGFG